MYKCTKCGSVEVETLTWVDMNTGDEMDGDAGEYYCRGCKSPTDVFFDEDEEVDTIIKDYDDEDDEDS